MGALYQEYDEETLKKLQKLELEMLQDFINLCDKYGIDYFGDGGTAIGAVRHGGFIPWDDDIDIGLMRKDFERFLEVAEKDCSDKYKIINTQTDPAYPFPTTRWIMRGTEFREECLKDVPCETGIFLDIYCFDNVPDEDWKMKIQAWKAWFWGKLLVLRAISDPVLYFGGVKAKLVRACCKVGNWVLRVLHLSPQFLHRMAMKEASRYKDQDTKRIAFMFNPKPMSEVYEKAAVYPTQRLDFDGLPMKFPRDTHKCISTYYGEDYMQLPPEDKRHNHPPYALDFGEH